MNSMGVIYCKDTSMYKVYRGSDYDKSFRTLREAKVYESGHHWLDGDTPDPEGNFGFVYLITDELTGMMYVGYKQYRYFSHPCKSSNDLDHKDYDESCWVPSGWESYTGSSKLLNPIIAKRPNDFKFQIISQYRSKLKMMLGEIDIMMSRDVLNAKLSGGGRAYWNQHIGGAEYNLFGRAYKIKHGYSYHPLYHTWKVNKSFMCDEWKDDPQGFCDTIEKCKEGYAIKRRDPTQPFSKTNWKFVSLSTVTSTSKMNKNNTTGYTGVTKLASGKFNACIYIKGKRVHVGIYPTAVEAALFRNEYISTHSLPHTLADLDVSLETVQCRICGKDMRVMEKALSYYCSYECGKGKIEVPCGNCGSTVMKYPAELRKSTKSFCNKKCYDEYQGSIGGFEDVR